MVLGFANSHLTTDTECQTKRHPLRVADTMNLILFWEIMANFGVSGNFLQMKRSETGYNGNDAFVYRRGE